MDKVTTNELILQHWGIKGQKWGYRRYQNKDGSLTPAGRKRYGSGSESTDGDGKTTKLSRKQRKEQARKAAEEAKAREEAETVEQKRERLLKSSDASELYKNRDLLTTAEINERLNRIDTERRLAKAAEDAAPVKKTVMDRVDTALKVGKKINEVYEFTNTPVMKALKKKLGIEKDDEKKFDIKKIYENRDKMSNKDIQEAANRSENYNKLKKLYDESKSKTSDSKPTDSGNNFKPNSSKPDNNDSAPDTSMLNLTKDRLERFSKKSSKVANTPISKAKSEVADALSKVPKNKELQKEAAKEIIKEVKPELDEILDTFNKGMLEANQRRLDEYNRQNK